MGPLHDIRVADFTRVLSGPYATMVLGDLGADVIKVERPDTGDETRGWGPPFVGGESAYYLCVNRNKRSIAVDLQSEGGREAARRLIATSHVLVENFRPGTMERLGLGYDDVRSSNERLVYCSISGFGLEGPDRDRPGYDFVVQGMGGVMSITGEPDGPPEKVGVAIADITAGLFASIAILGALRHAEATGGGQRVHTSLFGSQVAWLANQASNWLAGGVEPNRMGNRHPNIVPYEAFDAADEPFIVAVGNEAHWRRLCEVLGRDDWLDDPRFATNAARVANRDVLIPLLADMFAAGPRTHWLDLLARAEIPAGPINTVAEVFEGPPGDAMVETIAHPAAGDLRLVRSPLELMETPAATRLPPPLLGQHTVEVLMEIGYSREDADAMGGGNR